MAILKCKICGGDMEITADKSFGICEYCGSTMTLPKIDDEQRADAFNRGNHFRRIGEFDKALQVYERIVTENPNDAEAHWCCALCRFGIEWVEDPTTMEYLPTCHRASFDIFTEDVDYISALNLSDGLTQKQYKKDGMKIAEVQRGILATSQNEKPFDIFICYKESDESGNRTVDSTLAQDIYYQLTDQGLRVFFSRITLEDKAGSEYEPYIFAALNSAKVMVVVGTKPEHFNAIWVKNEWSRFLSIVKHDRSKIILPCYKNMNPYDLPEQLSVLQSYDMSKIGFIQDLIRGIKKITDMETPIVIEQKKETVIVNDGKANIGALTKRGMLALEIGDWKRADEFFEQVLNIDAENVNAYLAKLMIALKVTKVSDLEKLSEPFDDSVGYRCLKKFADSATMKKLEAYNDTIRKNIENAKLQAKYDEAVKAMNDSKNEDDFLSAASMFATIASFNDATALENKCIESANKAKLEKEMAQKRKLKRTALISAIVAACAGLTMLICFVILPSVKYNQAEKLFEAGNTDEAYVLYSSISYKDSNEKASEMLFEKQKDNLAKIKKGDVVKFGVYEQDNDLTNGKEEIEWIVIDKKDNKYLLLSQYVLDCQKYNNIYEEVSWDDSSIRTWLNNNFYKQAFGTKQQELIQPCKTYLISSDENDFDNVFLLNSSVLSGYDRAEATDYTIKNGVSIHNTYYNSTSNYCLFWTNSSGSQTNTRITPGVYSWSYNDVDCNDVGVRPAIWISVESLNK